MFITTATQDATFTKPASFTPELPVPLAVYFHGQGDTSGGRIDDPTMIALRDAGFATMTCDFHGNNWGNQAAINDLADLLAWVTAGVTVGPVLLFGASMGGLASLNALHRGALASYDVRGWYGTMPACNLAVAYAVPTNNFTTQIRTAYGFASDAGYAAATAGYDPVLAGSSFPLIRYRFLASPEDTLVTKEGHTDVMREALPDGVRENSLLVTSGAHGHISHWNAADISKFALRCLADG